MERGRREKDDNVMRGDVSIRARWGGHTDPSNSISPRPSPIGGPYAMLDWPVEIAIPVDFQIPSSTPPARGPTTGNAGVTVMGFSHLSAQGVGSN